MKKIDKYILEKLKINKDLKFKSIHPKNKRELRIIIEEKIKTSNEINLSNIDISDVDNLRDLFFGLQPEVVNISNWDVSHIRDFSGMFKGCKNLKDIFGIENLDMRNATNLKDMFYRCESLIELNLENWRFENLEDITSIFYGCKNLSKVGNLNNWDTDKLKEKRFAFTNTKIKDMPKWI